MKAQLRQKADNYIGLLNCQIFKPVDWEEQVKNAQFNMDMCDETIKKLKRIQKELK